MRQFLLLLALALPMLGAPVETDLARCQREARNVTITRDDWGIAHVHGGTNAEAVFGMIYAQAEDDFPRMEANYLNAMGRAAESEGEIKIVQDLRMQLFIDPAALRRWYVESPSWLRTLMEAWADGLNFYLSQHPETKPRVLSHFEPWMALSFTEGSIGGDIEGIDLHRLEAFYSKGKLTTPEQLEDDSQLREPSGSNGIAIAPQNTLQKHALLLINPHTSFFFRSELQMASNEGLDAYGAVTWGQFFIYQGFNEHVGWMHTSSGVDAVDEYAETVQKKASGFVYQYGAAQRPVTTRQIVIRYKTDAGLAQRTFTVYRTHHGPVIRSENGKWIAVRLMQEPVKALMQSFERTEAASYQAYRKTMDLRANSSNNTIFADDAGDIAYFHGNFIPRRETKFDWTKPVDGSDPATEWRGLLSVDEGPHLLNPKSGWLYNSNNWPWSGAGESSLRAQDFPAYVETGTESPRGLHAIRLLKDRRDFTLESLVAAAYDSYLPWFEAPREALLSAWDRGRAAENRADLGPQINVLRGWDLRWRADSVATSLAVFWGEDLRRRVLEPAQRARMSTEEYVAQLAPAALLDALERASRRLSVEFGTWKTPWGGINRFQRLTGDIAQPFSDAAASLPVPFTSSVWGSLASFGARPYPHTREWYGTSGNSFVAAVEFGPRVRALAVTAGGESGHADSKHFDDQAQRYTHGDLRPVYFYKADLQGHIERQYRPGE